MAASPAESEYFVNIKGVGPTYSKLLQGVGVESVRQLADQDPPDLLKRIAETNSAVRSTNRLPGITAISGWIEQARNELPGNSTKVQPI